MLASVSDKFGGFNLAPWVLLSYTLSYLGTSPPTTHSKAPRKSHPEPP